MEIKIKSRKAQEEMVGFAMIIILVAIIILVFLGISLNKPSVSQGVESFEAEGFIQALLQHTTTCSTDNGASYNDIASLIAECDYEQICWNKAKEDEIPACTVLNSTLKNILDNSWKTGQDRPVKGYLLNITLGDKTMLSISSGNTTVSYKGGISSLSKKGSSYNIEFRAYY